MVFWGGPPDVKKLKADGNIKGLIKALRYKKDRYVRVHAAKALGEIGDARAVKPLIVALNDEEIDVGGAAKGALVNIGNSAVEPLIDALKHKESSVRRWVAIALEEIGDPQAVESLIIALKDGNGDVRFHAARALKEIGDARAQESFIIVLNKGEDVKVEQAAASALGKFGNAGAVPSLVSAIRRGNPWVVKPASKALVEIGDPQAVEPLIKALEAQDVGVRKLVAEALAEIGDARAVHPLTVFALKDNELAATAIYALTLVLKRDATNVEAEDLRAVIHLNKVEQWYGKRDERYLKEVDCSEVKELASQELTRRGLKD